MSPALVAAAVALARKGGCSRAWVGAGRLAVAKVCPEGATGLKVATIAVLNPFLAYVCARGGLPTFDQVVGDMCEGVKTISPEEAIREGGRIARGRIGRRRAEEEGVEEEENGRRRGRTPPALTDDPLPKLLANLDYRKAEIDQVMTSGMVPPEGAVPVQERLRVAIGILSGRAPRHTGQTPAVAGLNFGCVFDPPHKGW